MTIHTKAFLLFLLTMLFVSKVSSQDTYEEKIIFTPIKHATFIIQTQQITIYVDPVGETKAFSKFPQPAIILITDTHGDHLAPEVVNSLKQKNTRIIGPEAVVSKLKYGEILKNGENKTVGSIKIAAIPMYNTTEDRLKYHNKGRGNGYVLTVNKKRIYISGDTEDIPEMRNLDDIDYAFVCMNLPYTMTVEQAASAVLEFKPKVVFPYHYKGSDVEKFKKFVSKNKDIDVRLLDWY